METTIIIDPLLPAPVLWTAVALVVALIGFAIWRGLGGWWLRGLALATLVVTLANPSLQTEDRDPLSDIVIVVIDDTASQNIADRPEQVSEALAQIESEIAALPNTEMRVVTLEDGESNSGSLLMTTLNEAMAQDPRARLAGAILITDGQIHDIERAPDLPAPLHALLTGQDDDWDRRLLVQNAPAFAIIDEPVTLTLRIEDQGAVPRDIGELAQLFISVDGGPAFEFQVPIGEDLELPVTLPHGGANVIQFIVPALDGELTDRNNAAVVQINGVRDRLRVLLVSGEPHAGERTWRNLLKSDSAVDLVHFTILRPPEKQDGVPVAELSLIAFPTRELFLEKIDEFDLIIFDRYKRRGILPSIYLDNVRRYVEGGGAILVAAGPDFASASSIFRSPVGDIMPGVPTGRVIEEGFHAAVTDIGQRHPVTEGLIPETQPEGIPPWGRWLRLIEVQQTHGTTVMTGIEDRPALIVDRVGEGRVALLASDHIWLWNRGYEGGGPQLELLRRLAHWMMQEPELEEEALTATAEGQTMTITRRSLSDITSPVEITGPDGSVVTLQLEETSPGRYTADWVAPEVGLYRLKQDDLESVTALGPAAPREFEATIASGDILAPVVDATRGGILSISDGPVDIRTVRQGRPAAGRGWIAINPREAYVTTDVTVVPLLPAWAWLMLAALFAVGAWLIEGRRSAKPTA